MKICWKRSCNVDDENGNTNLKDIKKQKSQKYNLAPNVVAERTEPPS